MKTVSIPFYLYQGQSSIIIYKIIDDLIHDYLAS